MHIDAVGHVHRADGDLPEIGAIGLGTDHRRRHRHVHRGRGGVILGGDAAERGEAADSGQPERAGEFEGFTAVDLAAVESAHDVGKVRSSLVVHHSSLR